jgi:hypothetical protein
MAKLPIIAVTAHGQSFYRQALEAGATIDKQTAGFRHARPFSISI